MANFCRWPECVAGRCHWIGLIVMPENIYPEFARMLGRDAKERLLKQRGSVIWMYGLSGSGKSTLANALERCLHEAGFLTQILDGDNMRTGLNRNLGFSDDDRSENIRRVAEVAKLYLHTGIVTLASFITPRRDLRQLARATVGAEDFLEVYVRASFETCARRDPKGLYGKVAAGEVRQFTGRDSGFEEPSAEDAAVVIDTEAHDLPACLEQLQTLVLPRVRLAARF